MTTAKTILNVLNPEVMAVKDRTIAVSPRLKDLTGKKIGIIFNDKPMGRVFLPYLQESLRKHIDGIDLQTWMITTMEKEEIKQARITECVQYSDAVVALLGD
jgi:hypothetical protein